MKTVLIIGGGASGMAAALSAAASPDNCVVLLERQARVGRKLLSTGNGRCNLTNMSISPANYHGEEASFTKPALSAYPPESILSWFRSLGLVCTEQPGGRVYPFSDSASSVLDVLRYAMESSGVCLHTGESVLSASCRKGCFYVQTTSSAYQADALIVACGGKAGGKVGGVTDGYDILRSFGHRCSRLYPALVPLHTDTDYPRALKGIRTDARIRLISGSSLLAESCGEVQFTEKGISGPAVFDVSRAASIQGGELELDLFRSLPASELLALLRQRRGISPDLEAGSVFVGMLHSRLSSVIVRAASIRPSVPLKSLTDTELSLLAEKAKNFRLRVTGTDSFDAAQVTAGGILTSDFAPETLESRLVPGLFACGEVLDVDGDCGGYNLQWAWASGLLAGRLAK